MFAVEAAGIPLVGDAEQFLGVKVDFSSFIYLQLHAEKTGSGAKEDRRRLVVVILDGLGLHCAGVAGVAQRVLIFHVVRCVSGLFRTQQGAAPLAAGVVLFIAPVAERVFSRTGVVPVPDTLTAMCANYGFRLQTIGTQYGFSEDLLSGKREFSVAAVADKNSFVHMDSS